VTPSSAETAPRLLLLDGHSLAYRAFYALPVENFATKTGQATNAVFGFTSMLINMLRDEQPTHIGVAFDVSRHSFRTDQYAEYKAGRAKTPDVFTAQVSLIREVLDALGIRAIQKPGYEADDVIATLATKAAQPVDVVTGDRDLFQLVDDKRQVRVFYTVKGLGKLDPITEVEIGEKYDIPGDRYADFAVLRGDPSDGLPGVPGIGEKTAAALIRAFGDLDNLKNALDKGYGGFPTGTRKKLEAARSYLDVAPPVVRTATDVPLADDIDGALPAAPPDPDLLTEIGAELGLGSSLSRFRAAVTRS
jgi:DNA polymerase-1